MNLNNLLLTIDRFKAYVDDGVKDGILVPTDYESEWAFLEAAWECFYELDEEATAFSEVVEKE